MGSCSYSSLPTDLTFFPPSQIRDVWIGRQNPIQSFDYLNNPLSRVNLLEESANDRLTGLDKAKIAVVVFLIASATDPEWKGFIRNRHVPAPVFSGRILGFNSFIAEALLSASHTGRLTRVVLQTRRVGIITCLERVADTDANLWPPGLLRLIAPYENRKAGC